MSKPTRRICQLCGREFMASPKARWCCNACKQAAYRARLASKAEHAKLANSHKS